MFDVRTCSGKRSNINNWSTVFADSSFGDVQERPCHLMPPLKGLNVRNLVY